MEALAQSQTERFELKIVSRLRQFFPDCRNMNEAEGRELVRYGIERAAVYDIVSERDVAKYIGLLVVWGRDFEQSASDPWVISTLADITLDPSYRVALLCEHAARGGRP
jgi:hypothetical protein